MMMNNGAKKERRYLPFALLSAVAIIVGAAMLFVPAISPSSGDWSAVDVVLSTDPPGTTVFINGHLAGVTPLLLKDLRRGDYSLRLEKNGYVTQTRRFNVGPRPFAMRESLPAIDTAEVMVAIRPDGAEIYLDGEFQGHTPLRLPRVPVGSHELVVSKPNYDSYVQRMDVTAGKPLSYAGFELNNKILAMLKSNVAKERWRVSHYIDLGHYLFVNDRLTEAAETYAQALAVAGTEIEFPAEYGRDDKALEVRLRAEDVNRLNEELRHKEHYPGKELTAFKRVIETQRELLTHTNYTDWKWVNEQVLSFARENRYADAQTLLLKHIDTLKVGPSMDQAHMALLSVRMRLKQLKPIQDSYTIIINNYSHDPSLMRQAACTIYGAEADFEGTNRTALLTMSDELLRKGLAAATKAKNPEQIALLNLNLGNVLMLQEHAAQAEPCYRVSIEGTADLSTKEDRTLRLAACLKALKKWDDARKTLSSLLASKRPEIAEKARQELKAIDLLDPSPDNH
jgi:tetratricopeptide (TPR) repeat protein